MIYPHSPPGAVHTDSGRPTPCPEEECPYQLAFCELEHTRLGKVTLDQILRSSYQSPIHTSRSESIACFVVRSEWLFHGDDRHRLSLRRHLYERLDPQWQPLASQSACQALSKHSKSGYYFGFVDLRTKYGNHPLALGILAPPQRMLEDPDCQVITGNYGPLFGGPAFPATVYSMQDDTTAGAACAQSAMIAVLGMMTDRGAVLEGSYALTMLGYEDELDRIPTARIPFRPPEPPRELAETIDGETDGARTLERLFPASGLKPYQMARVLCKLEVNAKMVVFGNNFTPEEMEKDYNVGIAGADCDKLALRMIQCHVSARCPVILAVNSKKWENGAGHEAAIADQSHAVTIIGVRRKSIQHRDDYFIVHDPARQPFVEHTIHYCFAACRSFSMMDKVFAIFSVEKGVGLPLHRCVKHLWSTAATALDGYFGIATGVPAPGKGPKRKLDYQFALLPRGNIHSFLCAAPLTSDQHTRWMNAVQLNAARYWVLGFYENGNLRKVWLYPCDAKKPRWELRLDRVTDSPRWSLTRQRPGGQKAKGTFTFPAEEAT